MVFNVINVPAGCSFVDSIAEKFIKEFAENPEGLSDALFLMPSRRACLSLRDAFVRCNGLTPSILPRIAPIGETDEDEVYFRTQNSEKVFETVPPAVDEYERLFLLSKMIVSKPAEYGLPEMTISQAFELAKALGELLDISYNEQLSFENLKNIIPVQYAAHWQQTLNFLKIISEFWPKILKERGITDRVERKNALLSFQARLWEKFPPKGRVIAAGITATFPGYKNLLTAISKLANGEIFLYGLDRNLDERAWKQLEESHPQYELKQLLESLDLTRWDVKDLLPSQNPPREKLISEVMRPASVTMAWTHLKDERLDPQAFSNLHLLNCSDLREEAAAIALIMRETVNIPGKTAALVTTDRDLARRVSSALEQWNIKIDDSAGKPLQLTPPGIFLRLIIQVLENQLLPSNLLLLAKNPYVRLGHEAAVVRRAVRLWEKERRTSNYNFDKQKKEEKTPLWLQTILDILQPLAELYSRPNVDFKKLLEAHIIAAEKLSASRPKIDKTLENRNEQSSESENSSTVLWRGDDGKTAAALFSRVLPVATLIGQINPAQYSALLISLMSSQTVRASYGTHPRLKILGPIEARFNQYDKVIIGGMNEGIWPKLPGSDPWMSRPMKKDFGMSLPEKAIGVLAGDFSRLACAPEVWLTRSERAAGTPMNKSRWWQRFETVIKAYGLETSLFENKTCQRLIKLIETPEVYEKISPPAPKPPLYARPRKLSASSIEVLMRDPYEIYVRKILRLKPLEDLNCKWAPSDYGSLIHQILEKFNNLYPKNLPQNAREELLKVGSQLFELSKIPSEVRAFWWSLFEKTADWLIRIEQTYRCDIAFIYNETEGSLEIDCPGGSFLIEARADRLDYTMDGKVNIIDYKTGEPRSAKEVTAGYAPQLPIEGLIARAGGFKPKKTNGLAAKNIQTNLKNNTYVLSQSDDLNNPESQNSTFLPPAEIDKLIYWKLGEKSVEVSKDTDQLLDQTLERLQRLIGAFDFESTPYLARPNPKHLLQYSEYEHLARVKEWSVGEADD